MTRKRARKVEPRAKSGKPSHTQSAAVSGNRDDVASLRTSNDALEKTNSELRCLDEYRSRFLARLSHELRNPLTSILGFTEILLNHEQLTVAQEDFCRKIQHSALQIETNLNQLADLSRLSAGEAAPSLEEFSLSDALRETCLVLGREAKKQGVELHCQADNSAHGIVSDRSKVRQVLYNFLVNAINRSPEGAAVHAILEKRKSDFRLKIEDEGERLSTSSEGQVASQLLRTGQNVATGELGLAIARQLIHAVGAKLSIHDREPRGVVVSIQFPGRPPDLDDRH